ncbi:MAG: hypothetical protein PHN80_06645, partial [Hespellia sp.]|nr:hypothetical protein [Hespellia sp.]
AIKTYHQMRGLNDARQISDTLLEKITGEIEGAWPTLEQKEGEADSEESLHIYESGKIIQLRDRTGSMIAMTASDNGGGILNRTVEKTEYAENQLLIYYYQLNNKDNGGIRYEAVDWTYDAPASLGYQIDSLTFSQADPTGETYPKNVIKVVLTVKSDRYGSFTATRYVEMYNFKTDQDFDKIKDEGNSSGGGSEGGESGGGNDTGLDFVVDNVTFSARADATALYDAAAEEYAKKNPTAPPLEGYTISANGYYKNGDSYYYATSGAWYNASTKQIGAFSVKINQNKQIKEFNDLIVIEGDSIQWKEKPDVGDVIAYNNNYYLVIGGGISQWVKPDRDNNCVVIKKKQQS